MKIRHYIYIALGLTLTACSHISESEHLEYVEPATVSRNILIEDFTGQKCVNCPLATDIIHSIQETYDSEHIISVAIHSGKFGVEGNAGLVTEPGKEYWNKWFDASQGQPVALINRGTKSDEYLKWGGIVASEWTKTTTVKMVVSVSYDDESRTVTVNSTISDSDQKAANYQLWLVEDSVVAAQYQPDNTVKVDYVHNHLFRDAINGVWGDKITYTDGKSVKEHKYVLPQKYQAKNCSVIAFVYNDEGVEQVYSLKITNNI